MESQTSSRTGDRSYLRRRNSLTVLETLWNGPATIGEIARDTSLSRTAAESVLGDLIASGWAVDGGPPAQRSLTPGRPASVFHFSPDAGHIAGVDIGAHHVSACIADLSGDKISTLRVTADERLPAAERLALARRCLKQVLRESGLATGDLWALTVGSPGVIDKGKVIHFGGAGMPGWIGLDIAACFADVATGVVLVEGDSVLGALAESSYGAGKGVSDLVYILSGIRTGAAVVVNGHTLRGHRGAAGLVGELPELRWRDIEYGIYAQSRTADEGTTRSEVFDRARAGDKEAQSIVRDFASALAVGAAAMVLALDPEVLVIGGPNIENADLFMERFTAEVARRCPILPDVRISSLGQDAVLTGSVRLGLDAIGVALREAVETQPAFPSPSSGITAGYRAA